MKIIDLTHVIEQAMPVFPGTEPPKLQLANTLEKDGFLEHIITMYSHTGTHMDAPSHMAKDGLNLDEMPISQFIGKAVLIDVAGLKQVSTAIGLEDLYEYRAQINQVDFLILKTNWSDYWGEEKYFKGFPALTEEAADWLTTFNLKGIGIDAISIDAMETTDFKNHHIFFNKGMVIIENLTNLASIDREEFVFSCLPLKTLKADGSPIRAIAILTETVE